ncbi:hypothetical protein [Aeromonas sp. FDAARGOS 1417]|uniref:hypothetical protein n=1 Tax=Aeromonas TaxID=642 RepID=UPI001C23FCC4|nr:hypothetical protein [Aeromonas sp. FDAARGOS 1417]QWZ63558.1 hypothetical protein I6L47_18100 [Aeromonas sp. FDAARGOS 1417]
MELTEQEWMAVTLAVTMTKGLQKYKDMGLLVKVQYEASETEEKDEFISAASKELEEAIQLLQSAKNKLEAKA